MKNVVVMGVAIVTIIITLEGILVLGKRARGDSYQKERTKGKSERMKSLKGKGGCREE